MRYLIINADGYGFTEGITRAIEKCVNFGTVKSISVNVNFPFVMALSQFVKIHPELSVGCHLNPVVGKPVLPVTKVPSLVNETGEFFYKNFSKHFLLGKINKKELRSELLAQIEKTRRLAGETFSHIDFHMGLHRLPGLYPIFLDVVKLSGVGRIRTHRYLEGLESPSYKWRHLQYVFEKPARPLKYLWNILLRWKAKQIGLAMPDYWVGISNMTTVPGKISVEMYQKMISHLPNGFSEFVVHPGYADQDLQKYSSYIQKREEELNVLTDQRLKDFLSKSDVRLSGYRDIPLCKKK
ncbi:MAG: ChbG/HpnK family deacetylase [Chlorobi bacterium]|nr:ChbG/HpnK family deacetylase [Chlorobiota bacterium]